MLSFLGPWAIWWSLLPPWVKKLAGWAVLGAALLLSARCFAAHERALGHDAAVDSARVADASRLVATAKHRDSVRTVTVHDTVSRIVVQQEKMLHLLRGLPEPTITPGSDSEAWQGVALHLDSLIRYVAVPQLVADSVAIAALQGLVASKDTVIAAQDSLIAVLRSQSANPRVHARSPLKPALAVAATLGVALWVGQHVHFR